jgi:CheY-like chemotaxis protein/anti-sigma regulatory factor (Ser/Thr protein kinase)
VTPPPSSPRLLALVVDDHVENRRILSKILAKNGFDVVEGEDGTEAVRLAAERHPDLILLDIVMPKMSGFEALEEIREADPDVPVVIVSAVDTPEASEEALRLGAVNFVRKPFDPEEIRFVVERIRGAMQEEADLRPTLRLLIERKTILEMGNDLAEIPNVVAFLGHELRMHYPGFEVPATEVKLALYEVLTNAIEHGNLEIDYDRKSAAMSSVDGMHALIRARALEAPYRDRKIHVDVDYEPARVVWKVRDDGPGFPHATVHQEKRLGDTDALHGRGLLLIRHYMHEVEWNATGNQILLALRLSPKSSGRRPKRSS